MVFNAILNSLSVILQRPVHLSKLSWSSFDQYSAQYSFQATGCFPMWDSHLKYHTKLHVDDGHGYWEKCDEKYWSQTDKDKPVYPHSWEMH